MFHLGREEVREETKSAGGCVCVYINVGEGERQRERERDPNLGSLGFLQLALQGGRRDGQDKAGGRI